MVTLKRTIPILRMFDVAKAREFYLDTYVANEVSSNVSAFAIDASTGALAQVTGSPFAQPVAREVGSHR
jgi:6-phosphogluconolactonase (cycloisomerase 2 family)